MVDQYDEDDNLLMQQSVQMSAILAQSLARLDDASICDSTCFSDICLNVQSNVKMAISNFNPIYDLLFEDVLQLGEALGNFEDIIEEILLDQYPVSEERYRLAYINNKASNICSPTEFIQQMQRDYSLPTVTVNVPHFQPAKTVVLYEYTCPNCDKIHTVQTNFYELNKTQCETCHSVVKLTENHVVTRKQYKQEAQNEQN